MGPLSRRICGTLGVLVRNNITPGRQGFGAQGKNIANNLDLLKSWVMIGIYTGLLILNPTAHYH